MVWSHVRAFKEQKFGRSTVCESALALHVRHILGLGAPLGGVPILLVVATLHDARLVAFGGLVVFSFAGCGLHSGHHE